jgi:hypothetical protein
LYQKRKAPSSGTMPTIVTSQSILFMKITKIIEFFVKFTISNHGYYGTLNKWYNFVLMEDQGLGKLMEIKEYSQLHSIFSFDSEYLRKKILTVSEIGSFKPNWNLKNSFDKYDYSIINCSGQVTMMMGEKGHDY